MNAPVPKDEPRIERLITLAEKLIAALEGDIAALRQGTPMAMKSMDPEVQKLSVLYGKEAQNFDIRIARSARADLARRISKFWASLP